MTAPIVIDHSKDSSYYIFEYLFTCKVPNLQSMSPDYIRHFGMPSVGNKKIDAVMANQLITVMIPISQMVEYYKEGVGVYISNRDDILTMYDFITHHLTRWKLKIATSINSGAAPVDDLIAMDEFANSVYDHAKYQFTREIADSLFTRSLSGVVRMNRNNVFRERPPEEELQPDGTTKPKEIVYPQRVSMAGAFREKFSGEKKWN
jgi:hypothetical protein